MRNLLLIHFESLNYTNYKMNTAVFSNLQKWEEKSIAFLNYFSTATSTLMVMSDLAYGGMLQNEPCDSICASLKKYCYQSSVFDNLKEEGYSVKAILYPKDITNDTNSCNLRHFIGYHIKVEETDSYHFYLKKLDESMTNERPFAVWACNCASNISYNNFIKNTEQKTGLERWECGFSYIDQCVNDVLGILERKRLLESTTIIFYGDHGDDIYSHGKHRGLTHAIEPYEELIHTPFWIYDCRFEGTKIHSLLSTTEIRKLIQNILSLPEKKLDISDIQIPVPEYLLSRNLYAAQKVKELSFHKAYSLTNGKFFFLAGDQGVELYHTGIDSACQHNLLDYFDLDSDKLILNDISYRYMKYHFRSLFDDKSINQIKIIFSVLRKELMKKVKALYDYAETDSLSLEIKWDKIHYSGEEKERRKYVDSDRRKVLAKAINHLLNEMQVNKLAIYGHLYNEFELIAKDIEKCRMSSLEETEKYEIILISLESWEEVLNALPWIKKNRKEMTIILYIREDNEINIKIKSLLDIIYIYHNKKFLKGMLCFIGKIFEYPDKTIVPENFNVLAILHWHKNLEHFEEIIKQLLQQKIDIHIVGDSTDVTYTDAINYLKEKYQEPVLVEDLTNEKDFQWYIYIDSNVRLKSPWKEKNLREAIFYIDKLGYNLINTISVNSVNLNGINQSNVIDTVKIWKNFPMKNLEEIRNNDIHVKNPKVFPLKILDEINCSGDLNIDNKKVIVEEYEVYERYLVGKKIVLYGAGNYGKYFYRKLSHSVDIVAWVDRDYLYMPWYCCKKIQSPDSLSDLEFDILFIAIADEKTKNAVKDQLVQAGIKENQIF